MALSKSMLIGMGLNEDQARAILDGHKESLDHYQEEANKYKIMCEDAQKKLEQTQKDLEEAKNLALEKEGKNPWKVKYDALHEEFEGYKTEEQKKAAKAAKETAYKALLKETGIAEKRIASVVRVSDLDSLELGEDGKFKNNDDLVKKIKEDWSDFIATEITKGAETNTPPANNGADDDDDSSAVSRVIAQRAAMYGAQDK